MLRTLLTFGSLLALAPAAQADWWQAVPLGAWSAYTPAITPGSGSYTAATATGRTQQAGKSVDVQIRGVITTQGTGGGVTNVTLPSPVAADTTFVGKIVTTGVAVAGTASAGSATIPLTTVTGAGFSADGATFVISGRYEAQ